MKSLMMVLGIAVASVCNNVAFCDEGNLGSFYEVAKENCHDIGCIRTEINRINNEILKLLAERTAYVKRAGDLKSQTTRVADDRQRVADQEKIIINKSVELGVPIEISVPAFRAIVEASIQFQQEYINRLSY